MARLKSMVLEIAEAEVGYLEKASNSQLDSKTANAGNNNYTKYARDLDAIPGFYNGRKQGYAWCDVFVDWCFVKAFGEAAARQLLCQPQKSLGAGVYYSYGYFKAAGRVSKTPYVGDQIFFGSSTSNISHTGLVYKVDSAKVYTIEGNASTAAGVTPNGGGVVKKSYVRNYSKIVGYGHPDYEDEAPAPAPADPIDHYAVRDLQTSLNQAYRLSLAVDGIYGAKTEAAVKAHLLSRGKTGKYVKWVQQRLTDIGYKGTMGKPDGIYGPRTRAAVLAYQKARKIGVDGIVGNDTVKQMIRKP